MAAGVVPIDVNRVGTSRLYPGMKRIAFFAITLFALAGCASGEAAESAQGDNPASESTSPSPSSERADAPSDAWAGEVLPDSTWTKTVTLKQAKKVGVRQAELPSNFGEDGLMPLTFVFERLVGDHGRQRRWRGRAWRPRHAHLRRPGTTRDHQQQRRLPGLRRHPEVEGCRDTLTIATVEKSGNPLEG